MTHLNAVSRRVDETLKRDIIKEMNELLCELSDDSELSQEDRYNLQMSLRRGVFNHGRNERKQREWEQEQRRQQLTRGGIIV